jgi:hypothetical protein
MRQCGIDPLSNDLGGGLTMGRPMHFILNGGKELLGHFRTGIVIDTGGVNIKNFAPEDLFRRTDIPDPFDQFFEVAPPAGPFEPIVVQGKAFDDEFSKAFGRPDSKLGAPLRFYPVANGKNCFQIKPSCHASGVTPPKMKIVSEGSEAYFLTKKIDNPLNLPVPLGLNYPEFPDSCLRMKFAFLKDIFDMFVNGPDIFLE